MADWKALEVKLPGKELVETVQSSLDSVTSVLELVKTLLETISTFVIDFSNPVRTIVEALLALVLQLFESLRRTGVYAYFDVPDPTKDPNFDRYRGGYQAFQDRFKASLNDSRDPFRPQPLKGSTQSGFVLIVADDESVQGMLRLVKILLKFFGQEFRSAQYAAPANVKVVPFSQSGSPVLRIDSLLGGGASSLSVEWSLATNQRIPDPGFSDLVATVSAELVPQRWLIERTSIPSGPELQYQEVETAVLDSKQKPIKRKERVVDENGDLFRKFEDYIIVDATTATSTYLLGQLGTFRYVDTVEKDTQYSYRVRAFSGNLDVSGTSINFKPPEKNPLTGEIVQRWPSADSDPVVMGRPSPIVTGRLNTIPSGIDLVQALENTFKMAFALGFHNPLPEGSQFDTSGFNTGSTPTTAIGRGSMLNQAGSLAALSVVGPTGSTPYGKVTADDLDPVTKKYPDVTQNYFAVKAQAAKLARATAMAIYESGEGLLAFRDLYLGGIPFPITGGAGYLDSATTIYEMVNKFNTLGDGFPDTFDAKVYETSKYAYSDPYIRLNLLRAVQFIQAFSLGGVSPDWVSVNLMQDVVPWTGKLLYEMTAKISGLLDAYQSANLDIQGFINAITAKIDALERFIQFLVEILNFLEQFSAGFYILSLPNTNMGIPGWTDAIDNAGGQKPPGRPGGYSAGVGFAYVGTDVSAFEAAFKLLF